MSPGALALWGAFVGALGATIAYGIAAAQGMRGAVPTPVAGSNGKNGHSGNGSNGNGKKAAANGPARHGGREESRAVASTLTPSTTPPAALPAARALFALAFGMMVIAAATLMTLILRHDFSATYVQEFSSRNLRFGYLIASFWAGQQGTFFLWSLYMGVIGLIVMRTAREYEAPVLAIASLMNLALLVVLLIKNPFAPLSPVPPDGQGLNPLLQNYWMRIHPPTLFLGFSSAIWPFAFAMAGLWRRDYNGWPKRAFPYAAFNFAVLGAGVSLGGFWAYEVLGWNGYWGWDNVENASLMPWIGATLLLHGLMIQRLRNKWHRSNFVLALIPFLMVLYASYLTRSGVLEKFSVHSFSSLGLSGQLGAWVLGFGAIGIGSLAWRWREIPHSRPDTQAPAVAGRQSASRAGGINRDTLLGWAAALFLVFLTVVWLGTSAPVITGALSAVRERIPSFALLPASASNVGGEFYKRTTTPLGVLFGLLVGLAAVLPWARGSWRQLGARVRLPAALSIGCGVAAWTLGVRSPWMLALITAGAFALIANGIVLLTSPRHLGRLGGYLAHVGVGLFLIGTVAANTCDRHQRLDLIRDRPATAFGYRVTFTGFTGFESMKNLLDPEGHLDISFARGNDRFVAHPPMYFATSEQKPMIAPAIHHYLFHDLYVEPMEMPRRSDEPVQVEVTKGQAVRVAPGVVLRPTVFKADRKLGMAGALVQVFYDNGKMGRLTPGIINFTTGNPEFVPSATKDGRIQLQIVTFHVPENSIVLAVSGPAVVPPGPVYWFQTVEISIKPLIRFVWLGEVLTVIGGLMTLFRRLREMRRQESRDEPAAAEPAAPARRRQVAGTTAGE